ncbi:MAG: SpoIIE family protein phosphatase [Eubacterium sp.]|nr:SpoIIE family protein phosphatase [Eubacterium sp.]
MKKKNVSEKKKKFRFPILMRIASLFLIALIISAVLTMVVSHRFMLEDAADQDKAVASVVATAAKTALGSHDAVQELSKSKKRREEMHSVFRYILSRTGAKYLYLYTVDEAEHKHNIVCAAADDEEDRRMNEQFGFGSRMSRPLYDAEREVLNGELNESYEFIDNDFGDVCLYVIPVHDDDKKIVALIGVDYATDTITNIVSDNVRILVLLGSLIFVIAYVTALLLVRGLVIKPIRNLSGRMKSFIKDRKLHIETSKLKKVFEDEITDIEGSFDEMANDISQYVEDIEHLASEKAQNQSQLDIAKMIQGGIVPREYGLMGNGYEIYGCEFSAKDVGGDFYDIFRADDRNIFLVVGDISGKGIYAALFMVMVKTSLREKLKSGSSLAEAMNTLNNEICVRNPGNMFATVFAMMLDTKTGVLKYANAGHNAPILLKEKPEFLETCGGIALGLFEDADIVDEEIQLGDGEGILLYTDGVTEAVNTKRKQFGSDRLNMCIQKSYSSNDHTYCAGLLANGIVDSVREYSEGLEQFDDVTCTALVYGGGYQKELTSDIASFRQVKRTMIESLGDNDRTRGMILACEEIFANIVHYSRADDVSFSSERSADTYSVMFFDNGIPFDPVKEDIREKDFEELDSGGMGILIARRNSKEMTYSRINDWNVLTLKFEV